MTKKTEEVDETSTIEIKVALDNLSASEEELVRLGEMTVYPPVQTVDRAQYIKLLRSGEIVIRSTGEVGRGREGWDPRKKVGDQMRYLHLRLQIEERRQALEKSLHVYIQTTKQAMDAMAPPEGAYASYDNIQWDPYYMSVDDIEDKYTVSASVAYVLPLPRSRRSRTTGIELSLTDGEEPVPVSQERIDAEYAELLRIIEQEAKNEEQKRQDEEKKRLAQEAYEADRAAWIDEHGSQLLQDQVAAGYSAHRQYRMERTALELEGREPIWDLDNSIEEVDIDSPPSDLMEISKALIAAHPEYKVTVVRILIDEDEPRGDTDDTEYVPAVRIKVPWNKHYAYILE